MIHDHRCPVDCGPEHDGAMDADADRQLAELDAIESNSRTVEVVLGKRYTLTDKGWDATGGKP